MSAGEAFGTLFGLVSLEPGDAVMIISDSRSDEAVARCAFEVAGSLGADPTWTVVRPRERNGDELPAPVQAALRESEIAVVLTSWSPSHSSGVREAIGAGVRVIGMPGIKLDLIERGAATADYAMVSALTDRFGEHLAKGQHITVSTELGTEFEASLGGWSRVPLLDGGPIPRGFGGLGNFPAGEAAISPIEGTTNGRIVVDLTTSTTRAPLASHVTLTVVDGIVVAIEGGEEADALRAFLDAAGPSARVVAEIALGTNERALHVGLVLEDEKKLGTAHVGLGNARAFGGLNESPVHVDVIFDRASVTVDGVPLLVEGIVPAGLMRREAIAEIPEASGSFRRSSLPTEVRDGRLHVCWSDARGIPTWSQVGDDDAARVAADYIDQTTRLARADEPQHARVLELLRRHRVIVEAESGAGVAGLEVPFRSVV